MRSLKTAWLRGEGPAIPRTVRRARAWVVAVPGRYSVSYLLVGPDSVAVIDAGSHEDVPGVLTALRALDGPARAVRYVLPTHLHFDHILGLDPLARRLGARVALGGVAHDHVTRGVSLRFPRGLGRPGFHYTMIMGWIFEGSPPPTWEDLRAARRFGFPWASDAFEAELTPRLDDGQALPGLPGWTLLATPGHADDAVCLVHADAGFLVSGDTVRNFHGGEWNPLVTDAGDYHDTREKLRALNVDTVFPGHGPVVEGRAVIRRLREMPFYLP
jgi:glyoxylase-like metal-dependent hydrolase (beta-lactamase superfamily II)